MLQSKVSTEKKSAAEALMLTKHVRDLRELNVAVAAAHARAALGVERVLIVDWDVHHGNGTQAIFDDDPSVFYVSLHRHPHYPGTGAPTDDG